MVTSPYKTCKSCGNRNHPLSGQCRWCGSPLKNPKDLFFIAGMAFIVLVLIVLVAYSFCHRPPSESKIRLPLIDSVALLK